MSSLKQILEQMEQDLWFGNTDRRRYNGKIDTQVLLERGAINLTEHSTLINMFNSPDEENITIAEEIIKSKIIERSLLHDENKWASIT